MRVCTRVYVKVCMRMRVYLKVCVGTHVCTCVHGCVKVCRCVHMYVHVCVRSSLSASLLTRAVCFPQSERCFVGVGVCISLTAMHLAGDLGVIWDMSPGWVLGGGEPADGFGEVVRFARGRARVQLEGKILEREAGGSVACGGTQCCTLLADGSPTCSLFRLSESRGRPQRGAE